MILYRKLTSFIDKFKLFAFGNDLLISLDMSTMWNHLSFKEIHLSCKYTIVVLIYCSTCLLMYVDYINVSRRICLFEPFLQEMIDGLDMSEEQSSHSSSKLVVRFK